MSDPSPFRIGIVQMAMVADPEDNMATARRDVQEAARQGADIVCLPELYRSLYFCQTEDTDLFDLAEPIPGPSTETLGEIAKASDVSILAPIFERRAPGLYHNSTVLVDPSGAVSGVYRKMHIPDDPLFYEKFYFTPGDLGFRAFDTPVGRVGTLICWDQWFPEAARLTALHGALVLFYPTAIGWQAEDLGEEGKAQRQAWQTVQRSHAIANGVFVAAVNRVGHEPGVDGGDGLTFWGSSFVCDPLGRVLAEAPSDRGAVLVVEIDPSAIELVRRQWPFLRDRRIDAYAALSKRFVD